MSKLFLLFVALASFSSCKSINRMTCYESKLASVKRSPKYAQVMDAAIAGVPLIIATNNISPNNKVGEKSLQYFVDSTYLISSKLDDAVFFNTDSSKCLLLVLVKSVNDVKFDNVLFVQGTSTGNGWTFSPHRLPDIPKRTYGIRKPEQKGKIENNSFEHLSTEGRLYVLTKGNVNGFGCPIDNYFWFNEQPIKRK